MSSNDPAANEPIPVPEGGPERLRLAACQRLLNWSIEKNQAWTTDHNVSGPDLLLISIFSRSTRTYEAVVRHLGNHAFGEQGLMLNRALFEDMIDMHWVSLYPKLAVQRLREHDDYSRLLRVQTAARHPDYFDGPLPAPEISETEHKKMRKLFGDYGQHSWTGIHSLGRRVELVLPCWSAGAPRSEVAWWHDWVHKLNNEALHPSAFSLGRLGSPTVNERDNLEWRFGSTPEWLTQALHGAMWTYSQTVGLMVSEFGIAPCEEFEALYIQINRDFHQAGHWEKTGRVEALPESPED